MDNKVLLQKEYCKENGLPFFAPTGRCWGCRKDVWEKISEERASSELITGCVRCGYSYCD